MTVFWRVLTGALVFLVFFFCPLQFTFFNHALEFYLWKSLEQQTTNSTATSSPSVNDWHQNETGQPPLGEVLPQLEEVSPQPRHSMAAEPSPAQYPQIIKRVDVKGKVGISFDDGPFPGMTEQYLDVLEKHNTRATFFMVGRQVGLYPGLASKVVEQGSEIGSHSWRHDRLDQLEVEQVLADLQSVVEQVYNTVGQSVNLMRPPYGRYTDAVAAAAQELNQQLILWDVDPRDWEDPAPGKIVDAIVEHAKPGSIIILHEGHQNTLLALPEIIQQLRERNLEPVPVSELIK